MYVAGAPKKRRIENILENYINDIKFERENIKEQREKERKKREAKYEEKKKQSERMHNNNGNTKITTCRPADISK